MWQIRILGIKIISDGPHRKEILEMNSKINLNNKNIKWNFMRQKYLYTMLVRNVLF